MIDLKKNQFLRGFSLIELLVAMSVLSLIGILYFRIISTCLDLISYNKKYMESLANGRAMLDRLGTDLESRVRPNEVLPHFEKQTGNDRFSFYSELSRESDLRGVRAISYRVNHSQIERSSKTLQWNDPSYDLFSHGPLPFAPESEYDILIKGVFRLELAFVSKSTHKTTTTVPQQWSEISAIVVAIAVIDPTLLQAITPAQLSELSLLFPDARENQNILALWEKNEEKLPNFARVKGRSAVRTYQRCYTIE